MSDKAVLCGINNYKSISDLRGCVNDVHNLRRLLTESFEFDGDNIQTYVDGEVTKKRISESFKWLADGAEEGDRLLFHFSGHGSYIPSEDSDEELDELVCLHDMNWADRGTYLIDEDLGELTRLVKNGRLTVILDCCHSGTGTRAITAAFALARTVSPKSRLIVLSDTASHLETGRGEDNLRRLTTGNTALFRSFREERAQPVFARFAMPPAEYRVDTPRTKVKRLSAAVRAELNHQLLAGARDDQTAADAFIGGKYNGAFSYYLCETVREMGVKSYNEVMEAAVSAIRAEGYSQEPQNEGPFGEEILFGGTAASSSDFEAVSPDAVVAPTAGGPVKSVAEASVCTVPLTLLADWLRVSEKLIDLATERSAIVTPRPDVRAVGDELVVYVHGISRHRVGYSAPWFQAIQPHLSRDIGRAEVLWSPLVNPRTAAALAEPEVQRFAATIQRELERRSEAQGRLVPTEARGARLERPRGSGLSIDDFARYMLVESTREAVLRGFDNIVRPLLAAGKKIHVIAHSWGTVVSYEGLRRLDVTALPGQVATLFLVGSALSIAPVRSNLFGRVTDGRMPRVVRRVVNLDAGGDIVGGAIGEHFAVNREFLGLVPTGCSTVISTNIALSPSCAHSSYFDSANLAVNRDVFAHFINNS